jgi:hypothetical protein
MAMRVGEREKKGTEWDGVQRDIQREQLSNIDTPDSIVSTLISSQSSRTTHSTAQSDITLGLPVVPEV